ELMRRLATHSRVALTGWDGDAVMCEFLKPHFSLLAKERRFWSLAKECLRYISWKKQPPPIGVRTWLRSWVGNTKTPPPIAMPEWLNPYFIEKLSLRERWSEIHQYRDQRRESLHPIRPKLYYLLNSPMWTQLFEEYDAEAIQLQI